MKTLSLRIKFRSSVGALVALPPDPDDRCGLYIHLPEGHPFNVVCKELHDPGFSAHHDGFNVSLSKVNNATISAWWGIAKEQPTLVRKVWYGAQAVIGAGICWTIAPIVWAFGSGRGK